MEIVVVANFGLCWYCSGSVGIALEKDMKLNVIMGGGGSKTSNWGGGEGLNCYGPQNERKRR
jgi:hypothetical protein